MLTKREQEAKSEGAASANARAKDNRTTMFFAALAAAAGGGFLRAKNPQFATIGGIDTDLIVGALGAFFALKKSGKRAALVGGIGLGRGCVALDRMGASRAASV